MLNFCQFFRSSPGRRRALSFLSHPELFLSFRLFTVAYFNMLARVAVFSFLTLFLTGQVVAVPVAMPMKVRASLSSRTLRSQIRR